MTCENEPRVREALGILLDEGMVYEVRALRVPQGSYTVGTVSGYYDDLDAMARDAASLSRQGAEGVYYTPNPVQERCIARSINRLTTKPKSTTSDEEVVERRWLLVDVDPERPSGLSSTDAEHAQAIERARDIAQAMRDLGWPAPLLASSGNGAHLMWRIREPNDDETTLLITKVLGELHERFTTETMKVDRTSCNAARIWKCPGTMARKGDQYKTMRHREAALLEPGDRELLTREQMVSFVGGETPAQNTPERPAPSPSPIYDDADGFDLDAFMLRHFPGALPKPYQGGRRWRIDCWSNPAHQNDAVVIEGADGRPAAKCSHDSCSWHWRDLRDHFEPPDPAFVVTPADVAELVAQVQAPKPAEQVEEDSAEEHWRKWLLMSPPNKDGEQRILKRLHNAGLFLEHHGEVKGCFGFNEMLDRVVCLRPPRIHRAGRAGFVAGEPLFDHHEVEIVRWLERRAQHSYSTSGVNGIIDRVARVTHTFHPVRDYLRGLQWDGRERLPGWLNRYVGAEDSRYHSCVGTWWLISAVARAFQPGCKVDHMLILEGEQGAGKSTTFRILGGEWFSDTELPIGRGGPDAYQLLAGVWIYELAELSGMDFKQIEQVKAYLTSSVDKFRKSYGRNSEPKPRNTVFAGTTNSDRYLRDTTGNRRFWPVRIAGSDLQALVRDRDQLWAEAVVRYQASEAWWPSNPAEVQMCAAAQRERTERDPWEDILTEWLLANQRFGFVPTTEIFAKALDLPKQQQHAGNARRLADAMAQIGWVRDRKRNGSRKIRGFAPGQSLAEPDTDLPI